MSFTAMAWASKQKVKSSSQKLVLLMLANYADDQDKCWPSKQTLAEMCCMSKSGICKIITQLETDGFLVTEKRDGTSSIIRLNMGVHPVDRGCPRSGQGVSTQWTGGVHPVDTILSMNQLDDTIIGKDISVDLEFDEFWAAYPKRPNNPKTAAKKKYVNIRKQKVSHETIVNAAKKYAAMRAGEDPKFTAQAVTWLNQWRFEDDYSMDGGAVSPEPKASDEELNKLVAVYPGHIGDREKAKKLLKAEMSKGVNLDEICLAAQKYSLFCKGPPYENRRITPAMLEPWLQFKWREMDAYEFCRVGADRIKTVRPVKK